VHTGIPKWLVSLDISPYDGFMAACVPTADCRFSKRGTREEAVTSDRAARFDAPEVAAELLERAASSAGPRHSAAFSRTRSKRNLLRAQWDLRYEGGGRHERPCREIRRARGRRRARRDDTIDERGELDSPCWNERPRRRDRGTPQHFLERGRNGTCCEREEAVTSDRAARFDAPEVAAELDETTPLTSAVRSGTGGNLTRLAGTSGLVGGTEALRSIFSNAVETEPAKFPPVPFLSSSIALTIGVSRMSPSDQA
jgi:hypothetical protein